MTTATAVLLFLCASSAVTSLGAGLAARRQSLRLLVDAAVDVDMPDSDAGTPALRAAGNGYGALGRRLQAAGLDAPPALVVGVTLGAALLLWSLASVVTQSNPLALLAGAGGLYAPLILRSRRTEARTERARTQLDRVCTQVASAMQAGASAYQALEETAQGIGPPIRAELHRVLASVKQGTPLREAIAALPARISLEEMRLVAAGFRLHFDTGVNLPEILADIVGTLRTRREVAAAARAATSVGRTQATILAALPFGFLVLFRVIDPGYLTPLFHTTVGQLALGGATVWICLGYLVTSRMLTRGLQI